MREKYKFIIALALVVITTIAFYAVKLNSKDISQTAPNLIVEEIRGIDELPNRVADVRALAWQKMSKNRDNSYSPKIKVLPLIGPNSLDCSAELIPVVHSVEKTFQGVAAPKSLYMLIGNSEKDKAWFEAETRKLLSNKFLSFNGNEMINPETVNDKGIGVIWADDPCNSTMDISNEDRIRVAHGFLHVLQTNQFVSTAKDWGRWGEVPRWLLEGGATLAATYAVHGETQEGYLKRPENFYELYNLGKDFYPQYMKYESGQPSPWAYTDKWENYRAYDVGSYACEIFIALKGPESIINLYGEYLRVGNFDQSFKNVFGITWEQAYPIISTSTWGVIEESTKVVMPYLFEKSSSS